MIENKPLSQKSILILVIVLFAFISAIGLAYFSSPNNLPPVAVTPTVIPTAKPTVTPTSEPTITPISTPNMDISSWKTYNSNLAEINLHKNLKSPFLFKYPSEWQLDEGVIGILVYAFDDHVGYDIGTVPAGKFRILISPDLENQNNEEIKSWCKNNLYNSGYKEILSEKYLEVDGNKAYLIDYKIGPDDFKSIRQICIAKPELKVMIYAEPLDPNYLEVFDKIISTFKFIE